MSLKIHAIVTGELAGLLSEIMLNGGPQVAERPFGYDEKIPMHEGSTMAGVRQPVPVYLITGGEKIILIDTGLGSPEELLNAYHEQRLEIFCHQKPEWEIISALNNVSITPDDIDIVFHTHLHFDHIGNNEYFKRARFMVPSEEMSWALNPPHHGGSGPYLHQFSKHVQNVLDQIELLDYEGDIIPGVKYFRLGAHSPGFTAVAVNTNAGRVVLAGDIMIDNFNIKYNWPAGFYYRLDEFETAYNRIRKEADIIIPGHDWKVWDIYPNGIIG